MSDEDFKDQEATEKGPSESDLVGEDGSAEEGDVPLSDEEDPLMGDTEDEEEDY